MDGGTRLYGPRLYAIAFGLFFHRSSCKLLRRGDVSLLCACNGARIFGANLCVDDFAARGEGEAIEDGRRERVMVGGGHLVALLNMLRFQLPAPYAL